MPHTTSYQAHRIDISYRAILLIALPVMLANLAVPIQSMIDTAIVGNMGATSLVAGLGIAAQVLLLLLGSFYFLQTSTSGISAQLLGRIKSKKNRSKHEHSDEQAYKYHTKENASQSTQNCTVENIDNHTELALTLIRALLIALSIALIVMVLKTPLIDWLLPFFGATSAVNAAAQEYLHIRFLGFPAELANYALFGWFAGLGMQQLVISVSNVILSVLCVYGLHMQLDGVATGTVISHYLGLIYALKMARHADVFSKTSHKQYQNTDITALIRHALNINQFKRLFALNGNIFIRTLLLTLSFAWITRLATQQGETFLASNVILLYVLSLSAFALDGIAVSAKTLVGQTFAISQASSTQPKIQQ